jgi:hypothetical protein
VDIDDDDLLRAKRKADRAGLDVPKPKMPARAASDDSLYPGRESFFPCPGSLPGILLIRQRHLRPMRAMIAIIAIPAGVMINRINPSKRGTGMPTTMEGESHLPLLMAYSNADIQLDELGRSCRSTRYGLPSFLCRLPASHATLSLKSQYE